MSVVLDRDGGDLTRTHRLGVARLASATRRKIIRRGKRKPCLRIVRLLFAALTDPAGVTARRPGAVERVAPLLGDWRETHRRLLDTETRMTTILDELRRTELATSITGLSAIGAAAGSWPRPGTRTGSPPPGRWSNTGGPRRRSSPAPSSAAPS
jgi:transposase